MAIAKVTGLPILEGIKSADDMPYPISYAIMQRARIDSFSELPKDKRPPRDLWYKPYKLEQFFDEIFERDGSTRQSKFVEFDLEDVE